MTMNHGQESEDLASIRREMASARREMVETRRCARAYVYMLRHFHRKATCWEAIAYLEHLLRGVMADRRRQRTAIASIQQRIAELEQPAWRRIATDLENMAPYEVTEEEQ